MQVRIAEKLRAGDYDGIAAIAELKKSPIFALLLQAYDRLRTERLYESDIHGIGHVERVMLLAAVIAMQQNFSEREAELLLLACSYHDIGRVNDRRDEMHGKRSADALPDIPSVRLGETEMRCVRAAVATHSTSDEMIEVYAKAYRVPDEALGLCRLLCRGLKDADNLDRVRLGDLDVRHLRFRESRDLAATAEEILHTV